MISCSKDLPIDQSSDLMSQNSQIEVLRIKIDSINASYTNLNSSWQTRKPLVEYSKEYAFTSAADAVGGVLGSKIGSWAGASVGVATSNPVIGALGYLAGRKLGSAAGAAVASIATAWAIDNWCKKTRATSRLVLNEEYTVTVGNPDNITDGELHNLILFRLLKDFDRYVSSSGELLYELLMKDAIALENEYCPTKDYTDEYISTWLPKAVEQTKRIVYSSPALLDDNTSRFLNNVYDQLIPEISMSKEEFNNANILNETTLSTYRSLDNIYILNYSKDIDQVIDDSKFNSELKEELKSSNSIILNSTLIWREVK